MVRREPALFFVVIALQSSICSSREGASSPSDHLAVIDAAKKSSRHMRLDDTAHRRVEINAHGSLAPIDDDGVESKVQSYVEEDWRPPNRTAPKPLLNRTNVTGLANMTIVKGPRLSGYEDTNCGGSALGVYVLPVGADMTGDHCLEARDADTGQPIGRIKVSCDGSNGAKVCIWHNASDISCSANQPFCMKIQAGVAERVSSGRCLPVQEFPIEKESFAKFTDFPADAKWPDCLAPPTSILTLVLCIVGGAVLLCGICFGIWYWCYHGRSHAGQRDGLLAHQGWHQGQQWQGQQWQGEQASSQPHPSGAVDSSGNPLPASLPGVPPVAASPPQFAGR